jgi:hypothetical protein
MNLPGNIRLCAERVASRSNLKVEAINERRIGLQGMRIRKTSNQHPAHLTSQEWFNPAAFAVSSFSYGNFGRNALRTPAVTDTNFSLFKNFMLTETTTLSFRAEFFNIFNIQNYGAPESLIGDPAAGRITSNVIPPRQSNSVFA